MKFLRTSLPVFVALALATASLAEDGVDLRLKLKAGQVLRYEGSSVQDMDIDMAGTKMSMKNGQEATGVIKVVSVDEKGNYRMEQTTERMKMSIQSPAMNMEYDSAKPEDKEKEKALLGKFCALMAGATFTATLSPTGKVLESSGMEEIQKKLTEAFPEAAGQIKMMTGKDVAESLWATLCQRPEEMKKPGETWAIDKDAMGMMRLKMSSKLDKVENGLIFVVPAGLEISFGDFRKPGEPANPLAAMVKTMKVTKSELTGSTRLEATTGIVQEAASKMVLDYGMTVPGSDQAVSYHMVQTMTGKLLPAGEKK